MIITKSIGYLILKIRGWKTVGEIPDGIKKCIILVAPHTSIEDFVIGKAFYWIKGTPVKFLMKIEFFKNPVAAWILKKMGGIPVNRGHKNHMVEQMIELFNNSKELNLVITPEGTRKLTRHWKKGFYYIAEGANVPVVLGFMDFKKKEAGFGPTIYPSGDYYSDLAHIQDFYKDIKAKFPEKFNLDEQYRNTSSPKAVEIHSDDAF
jgi:1-acyl-sn-glycerol-3-phosphate acyltransferase